MADLIEHRILQDVASPKRIIIMLHGMGQHSGYMEEAGRVFSERMQDTLIVMAEGPLKMHYSAEKTARVREKYDPGFDPDKARSWFKTNTLGWPLLSLKLAFNRVSVVHQINKLADHYRDNYGLQDKDIAFFGMSLGGAISLYSAIAREKPVAAVVSHSGMFFGFARAKSKPDVMMITGEEDSYLCDNQSRAKAFFLDPEKGIRRLESRGIRVTELWLPDLGHDMSAESIARASDFLEGAFRQPSNENPAPKTAPVPVARPA